MRPVRDAQNMDVTVSVDLPTGKDIWLVTGVFDPQTGKIGTLEIPLRAQSQTNHP